MSVLSRIRGRLHTKLTEAKDFRTINLFSFSIRLTLHKALIRSAMTQACLVWEFEPDTHVLKLQRLQNKVSPYL
jgi:hypothetical protein